MIFWIAAAAMAALAGLLLVLPLLRGRGGAAARGAYDLAIYRDQLAELERDLARGVLTEDQAATARTEIERRMLQASDRQNRPLAAAGPARSLALVLVLAVPAATALLYGQLGNPGLPGHPLAARQTPPPAPMTPDGNNLADLADRLAARLEQSPGDIQGWVLLARTYGEIGRYLDAAQAYRRAIANGDESAPTRASLGEVLTAAGGGRVGPEARAAFAEALERDPANPRALYYGGLAYAQAGRLAEALEVWRGLAAQTPPDAPWKELLDARIASTQAALDGAPPPEIARSAPEPSEGSSAAGSPAARDLGRGPGPSQEDVAAAAEMSEDQRQAFIRSMVDRLAARLEEEPDDLAGWLRLTRAYAVLGEREQAVAALDQASALAEKLPADAPEHGAIAQARAMLAGRP